jgi:2-polyprenyl-3-methyl-5-hydroxy-6-metoxy-1,4-benzoquinol methylase
MSAAPGRQSMSVAGLEHLLPLIAAKASVPPVEFHASVNRVFHSHESAVYDRVHREMALTLPRHFGGLVDQFLAKYPLPESITVLDIGCGTGLSAELLLGTKLGSRIAHLDLLDTSEEMLKQCAQRPGLNRVARKFICGTLDRLSPAPAYDVILTCSLLHHIPDLNRFFGQLRILHRQGGMFLHLQDPNGDFMDDIELQRRIEQFDRSQRAPHWLKRITAERVLRRLRAVVTGKQARNYIDLINEDLLRSGVIKEAMTDNELWSVTDIHIYNGKGISLRGLERLLAGYELVSSRSYSFFGTMYSELGSRFQSEEDRLLKDGARNGMHVAAAWRRSDLAGAEE